MRPLFADGINLPFVLFAGLVVLVPLMAFETFVEAFVLNKLWRLPFPKLCWLTFCANCWSLLVGIPTKMLNASLYSILLTQDIPGFFARYPFAVSLGCFIYFAITVLVEGLTAWYWLRRRQIALSHSQIWRGMLLANVATYIVLSPLYYFATRPANDIRQFSRDTRWTSHTATTILFVDDSDSCLKSIRVDGSGVKTIVPFPVADYLVSTNLDICLFRGTNGNLYLFRSDTGKTNLIWRTTEQFFMNQVAFSPSGYRVAFASNKEKAVHTVDIRNGEQRSLPLASKSEYETPIVAWAADEAKFFAGNGEDYFWTVAIDANGEATITPLQSTNQLPLLTCYGRVGNTHSWRHGNWGADFSEDKCGDLAASAMSGLVTCLRIYHAGDKSARDVLDLSVNPGITHLGGFNFYDVQFLDDCNECLFDANGYIYLLNIRDKHLGTLTKGSRFIQLTPRCQKTFQ